MHTINFGKSDTGLILSGTYGQVHNDVHLVRMAVNAGMELDAPAIAALEAYENDDENFQWHDGADTVTGTTADYFGHSADLPSEALEYLNDNACDDGVSFEWIDGDLMCVGRTMTEWEAEEAFEEMINECYPIVSLGGLDYDHARAWKTVDPIAYQCGMLDWLDGEGIVLV